MIKVKMIKLGIAIVAVPFVLGFTAASFQEDLSKKVFVIKLNGLQASQTLQLLQYTKQILDNPEKLTVIEKNNINKSLDSVASWINIPIQKQLADTLKKDTIKKVIKKKN